MKVRPLAFLLFTSVSPLLGASVADRVDRLEKQVSELQRLLNQIHKGGSSQQEAPSERASSGSRYVIRSGDSYWTIARRLNISVSQLERANPKINPRRLQIGKTLNIPGSSGTVSNSSNHTATGTGTYRVKSGDILGRISENHGIRLHELMSANPGLDPRRLRVGKILNIPGQAQKAAVAPTPPIQRTVETPPARPPQVSQGLSARRNPYLSKTSAEARGQTRDLSEMRAPEPRLIPVSRDSRLAEIAKLHRTTVAQLNQLNDVELSPEQMIRSGSQLYVPGR